MRSPLPLVRTFPLLVLLGLPVPAVAHDWLSQWRAMRAEYQPAFNRARMIERLDDTGLTAYVAEQNWLMNQQIYAEYHRLTPRPQAAAAQPSSPGRGRP
jgi:hypothetical protein